MRLVRVLTLLQHFPVLANTGALHIIEQASLRHRRIIVLAFWPPLGNLHGNTGHITGGSRGKGEGPETIETSRKLLKIR